MCINIFILLGIVNLELEKKTMTQNEFLWLCNQALVHPSIALENENIVKALKEKNIDKVKVILREEF